MAKNKHPIFRMHKIQLHPNRWLIWAGAYSVFVAIALLGYIAVSSMNFDSEFLASENQYVPWRSYTNHELDFSLRYPGDWSIEAVSHSSVDFVPLDLTRPSVNLTVFDADDEKAIRKGMNILDEEEVMVAGKTGVRITNEVAEGATETVIMVENNESIYVLRGSRAAVEKFIVSFNVLNE